MSHKATCHVKLALEHLKTEGDDPAIREPLERALELLEYRDRMRGYLLAASPIGGDGDE